MTAAPELRLVIGNKNYSSWSLRPWMLLQHLQLHFAEVQILLDRPDTQGLIRQYSPAGRVPVLCHGELHVWDSIAIGEYLCELTGRGLPRLAAARAIARAASAEMHGGFMALRTAWPMNARATGRQTPISAALAADIARIDNLWSECRQRFGADGPWLFGEYSLADAMYAPVVLRFRTYGAQLSTAAAHYRDTALADPVLRSWIQAAEREPWIIEGDEAGRTEQRT